MAEVSREAVAAALLDIASRGGVWGVRTYRYRGKSPPRPCGYRTVSAKQLAEAAGRLLCGSTEGLAARMAAGCLELRLTREGLSVRTAGRIFELSKLDR